MNRYHRKHLWEERFLLFRRLERRRGVGWMLLGMFYWLQGKFRLRFGWSIPGPRPVPPVRATSELDDLIQRAADHKGISKEEVVRQFFEGQL